jgi:nucleoside-diphosphate-sugar epimerase
MKVIGITGGTSNLGKYFLKNYKNKYKYIFFRDDITKKRKVKNWIKKNKFDLILHLAGIVAISDVNKSPKKAFNVNVNGTKNLINSIIDEKKKLHFIYLSSAQVYDFCKNKIKENFKLKPISIYGKQKLLSENYLKKYLKKEKDINLTILRVFSFTSILQKKTFFIPAMFNKIKYSQDNLFTIEKFLQKRDFIHIEDLCRCIDFILSKKIYGTYNVGSGKGVSIHKVIDHFAKKFSKKVKYINKNSKLKSKNLIPDITKLRKKGFKLKYNFEDILNDFI